MRKNQTVENITTDAVENTEVIENTENTENTEVIENTENATDTVETETAKRGRPAKYENVENLDNADLKTVVLSDDPTFTQNVSLKFLSENFGVNVSMDDYRILTNGIVKARVAAHAKEARENRETVVVTSAMKQIKDATAGMDAETLAAFLAAFLASQTTETTEVEPTDK